MHPLLDAFLLSQQVEEGKAPITLRNYRHALRPFLEWCGERDPRAFAPEDIQAYLAHVHRLLPNPFSRFSRIKPLKVLFRWMIEKGLVAANPAAAVKLPRLPEAVGPTPTVQDVQAILRACRKDTFEGTRDRVLVLMALDTGGRLNELRTLRLEDLHLGERVLRITGKARPGQAPAERLAPLSPGTLRALRAYLIVRSRIPGDALFCAADGSMLARRGFGLVIERLRRRAKVNATWHGLRRCFVTESLRSGCPEDVVRRIAGWRDGRMLARYAALRTSDLVAFHDRTAPSRFLAE